MTEINLRQGIFVRICTWLWVDSLQGYMLRSPFRYLSLLESMLTFFGTILILYLVWLLVKPLLFNYAQRKYREKINDMFGQAFNQQGFGRQTSSSSSSGQPPRRPGVKRKIFSRDEGEYVEFEEIEVSAEYRSSEQSDPSYTPREPQVSDADWEEIG